MLKATVMVGLKSRPRLFQVFVEEFVAEFNRLSGSMAMQALDLQLPLWLIELARRARTSRRHQTAAAQAGRGDHRRRLYSGPQARAAALRGAPAGGARRGR
jgi:hypothetical protein